MPFGIALGEVLDGAGDDSARVHRGWPVDRLEPPLLRQFMFDELAAGLARGGVRRGDQLDDLARVKRSTATGGDDSPGALVQRLDALRRRIVDLDADLVRRGHVEPQHPPAHFTVALAHPALEQDDLDPKTRGERNEALDEPPQLVRARLHHGPHVQEDPVPEQPAVDRAVGLVAAQRAEHANQHLLEFGQPHDLAALVVDGREVADLRKHEQTLILGIGLRDAEERVDVLRGRKPLEVELAEPPHVQPVAHHRVQAAEHGILDEATLGARSEREQVDRRHALATPRLGDCGDDPVQRRRDVDALIGVREHCRELLMRGGRSCVLGVEVEHREFARRDLRGPGDECSRGGADLVHLDVSGEDVALGVLEAVAADDEPMTAELDVLEALERAYAVVAARHRLDEAVTDRRPVVTHRGGQPRGQRPRAVDDRLDVLLPIGAPRVLYQCGDVLLHLGVDALGGLRDDRFVEVAQSNLTREIGDVLIPAVKSDDEPIERLTEVISDMTDQLVRRLETPIEDGQDRASRGGRPLLGKEQTVGRILERRCSFEALDAVVRERAPELADERLRQALALRVKRAQPVVEVLLGALELLGILALIPRQRAGDRAEVGEHAQQPVLARYECRVTRKQIGAQAVEIGDRPIDLGGPDVVAADEPLHAQEVLAALVGDHRLGRTSELGERQARPGRGCVLLFDRLERQQRRLRSDMDVLADEHLLDATVERRDERGLHLHRLDDRHDVTDVDDVTLGDRNRHDDRGRHAAHDPAIVARDPMGNPVDLYEHVVLLLGTHRSVAAAGKQEPTLVLTDPPGLQLELVTVDRHAVTVGRNMRDPEAVGLTAVPQLVAPAQLGARLGPAAPGIGVEACTVGGKILVGELDRRLHERDVRVARRGRLAAQVQPVQPGGVDIAAAHFGTVEQFEQESLIRRAARRPRPACPPGRGAAAPAPRPGHGPRRSPWRSSNRTRAG